MIIFKSINYKVMYIHVFKNGYEIARIHHHLTVGV